MGDQQRDKRIRDSLDDPPNSRLFIVANKTLQEEDFRAAFERFGQIEEIWVVKDRNTGDNKGVTYIKYSKTSEAARAMEAMNEKTIGNLNRSIKVMVAASRDQGAKREHNEEEKIQRLFVVVAKTMNEDDIQEYFKEFGEIDYVSIIRDRETRESKGFAYVKFYKFSHAAAAFEQCDRKYRPVFAQPRRRHDEPPHMRHNQQNYFDPITSYYHQNNSRNNMLLPPQPPPPLQQSAAPLPPQSPQSMSHSQTAALNNNNNFTSLIAIVSPQINQDQLWRLFDIIPGLDYCQLKYEGEPRPTRGIAHIVYKAAQWALHALEKLHGFEYPPGCRLIVKPDFENHTQSINCINDGDLAKSLSPTSPSSSSATNRSKDILHIAESIVHAAGLPPDYLQSKLPVILKDEILCSVELPDVKPLADIDSTVVARCFVVCTSNPPPIYVLKDVFSRFGDLIDFYLLNNRNCGYAKYASREPAEQAIAILHGAEVYGVRLKVMIAEERNESTRKRQKLT